MKIGYLTAFEKNSSGPRAWVSWHNKNSITWRWAVHATTRKEWPRIWFYKHIRHNTRRMIIVSFWRFILQIDTQKPMWIKA